MRWWRSRWRIKIIGEGGGWWSWSETRCSRTAGLTSPSEDPQDRSCNYFQDMNQPSHNACSFYLISLSVLAGMFCLSSSHHLNGGNHAGAAFRSVTAMVLGTSAIFTEVIPKMVLWKRLTAETSHHGNASKKRTHKTILMSSSINSKLKRLYSKDFHRNGRSARPPSLS